MTVKDFMKQLGVSLLPSEPVAPGNIPAKGARPKKKKSVSIAISKELKKLGADVTPGNIYVWVHRDSIPLR
ncbi:MAG: hypothetical protein ACRD3W_25040, partial [Terriglobales bacterium]